MEGNTLSEERVGKIISEGDKIKSVELAEKEIVNLKIDLPPLFDPVIMLVFIVKNIPQIII